jgi:two-component system NarL family sensor kinase
LAQEEERSRIAMDLHDELGNTLLSIKLRYSELLQLNEIDKLREGINESLILLTEAIQITRNTSHALMPETLNKYGLNSAINDIENRYKKSIEISFKSNIKQRLSQILELNIYRIINELISNSIKHANANFLIIELMIYEKELILKYSDNGVGFDYYQMINESKGIGVSNIKNRVNFLKGQINFEKENGSNFIIIFPFVNSPKISYEN